MMGTVSTQDKHKTRKIDQQSGRLLHLSKCVYEFKPLGNRKHRTQRSCTKRSGHFGVVRISLQNVTEPGAKRNRGIPVGLRLVMYCP